MQIYSIPEIKITVIPNATMRFDAEFSLENVALRTEEVYDRILKQCDTGNTKKGPCGAEGE